jgi:serine/threonine protein phosphatase PrpC
VADKLMNGSERNPMGTDPGTGQEMVSPAGDSEPGSSATPNADSRPIKISLHGFTDQGRVRKNNEDSLAACDLSSGDVRLGTFALEATLGDGGWLLLVADGMGGQACGELASRICSEQLPSRLLEAIRQHPTAGRRDFREAISSAFEAANRSILEASRADFSCHGMGTTATAALLHGDYLLVAQVGDSRAYLIRNGQLLQLTRDQTFLNYLLEIGAVDASSDSVTDPRRSVLTQAMGTAEDLQVVLTGVELCQGDRLLLASDGLYSMVPSAQLLSIAASDENTDARGRSLIKAANDNGGTDNITVILADISGNGLPAASPGKPVQVDDLGPRV